MKTSELIIKLTNSLSKYGDLPISMEDNKQLDIGWYTPNEGGKPEQIVFHNVENMELTVYESISYKVRGIEYVNKVME